MMRLHLLVNGGDLKTLVKLIGFFDVPKCTVKVLEFIYNYGYKEEYVCVCEGN